MAGANSERERRGHGRRLERRDASIARPDMTKETRQDRVRRNNTNNLLPKGGKEKKKKNGRSGACGYIQRTRRPASDSPFQRPAFHLLSGPHSATHYTSRIFQHRYSPFRAPLADRWQAVTVSVVEGRRPVFALCRNRV